MTNKQYREAVLTGTGSKTEYKQAVDNTDRSPQLCWSEIQTKKLQIEREIFHKGLSLGGVKVRSGFAEPYVATFECRLGKGITLGAALEDLFKEKLEEEIDKRFTVWKKRID